MAITFPLPMLTRSKAVVIRIANQPMVPRQLGAEPTTPRILEAAF